MTSTQLQTTALDYVDRAHDGTSVKGSGDKEPWTTTATVFSPSNGTASARGSTSGAAGRTPDDALERVIRGNLTLLNEDDTADPELKLPDGKSLFIVIAGSALFQFSFYVIVSSASAYAEQLGGSATFSGLIIGIPAVFSAAALFFVAKYDGGQYQRPFSIAYAAMVLANILHALAYRANWLYLLLIGRVMTGIGFTSFMFTKRYCCDPRIVGIRRRMTLASWLVVGQAFGFSAGPFLGGLLYKVGFSNDIFNGYTSPGWIMAIVWGMFWTGSRFLFMDVAEALPMAIELSGTIVPSSDAAVPEDLVEDSKNIIHGLTIRQWGVTICMCYYSMTCFFILGGWESNIPVFSAMAFGYSPYSAGNFIALGGVSTFPFLLLNVLYARRIQDRIILAVGSVVGLSGLLTMLAILRADKVSFGPFYVCWFLVALGYNLASTCTLSLLSKQLPDEWNGRISMAIQYSNYAGRLAGALMCGAGVKMGMMYYTEAQIAVVTIGGLMHLTFWREMKAKTG